MTELLPQPAGTLLTLNNHRLPWNDVMPQKDSLIHLMCEMAQLKLQ